MGMKEEDCWAVPLSEECHRAQHSMNERKWWALYEIDPCVIALALWRCSGDYETGLEIIRRARETA